MATIESRSAWAEALKTASGAGRAAGAGAARIAGTAMVAIAGSVTALK